MMDSEVNGVTAGTDIEDTLVDRSQPPELTSPGKQDPLAKTLIVVGLLAFLSALVLSYVEGAFYYVVGVTSLYPAIAGVILFNVGLIMKASKQGRRIAFILLSLIVELIIVWYGHAIYRQYISDPSCMFVVWCG